MILFKKNKKKMIRLKRSIYLRSKLKKNSSIRLVIHRTSRHIYAQIISSHPNSKVLASASTLEKNVKSVIKYTGNKFAAKKIGKLIARRAILQGIKNVSFDRSGFKYHGRISALAKSAREEGLIF
ncbi:50S ribosomal protein L18 [Buchnera aphidicola (Kurisakia onigurumii)]